MDEIVEGLVGRRRDGGIVIVGTEPGSTADEAGFRAGDVIEAVNDVAISSTHQFLMTVTSIKSQFVIVRVDRYIPSIRSKVIEFFFNIIIKFLLFFFYLRFPCR